MIQQRNLFLDEIKGIAILAVVLFHLGLFKWGYLGVDVFFVIAGYLTEKSISRRIAENRFYYFEFIKDRLARLWPLVILAGLVALGLGCLLMMPDDLDHMARSVLASNVFLNNLLCYHSNSDYWATKNEYAPMLHFWYLGVLMQFYVVYPLIARRNTTLIAALGLISLLGWCVTPVPLHFYNFPFRFFEFAVGIIAARLGFRFSNISLRIPCLATIGAASFSIYIWHYLILAYARYALAIRVWAMVVVFYAAALAIASWASYQFLEKRQWKKSIVAVFLSVNLGLSVYLVWRAGVIFDIPELDIKANEATRGMHLAYCDRIYAYEKDFPKNGKVNVLVMGNSWARDWANVLLESSIAEKINLSYSFSEAKTGKDNLLRRVGDADVVFVRGPYRPLFLDGKKVYHIGYKWFGPSNGYVWNRRYRKDYYDTTIDVPEEVKTIAAQEKSECLGVYIDLMDCMLTSSGRMPTFSDERKMISHDCYHLTRGGARFFAKRLDGVLKEIVQ